MTRLPQLLFIFLFMFITVHASEEQNLFNGKSLDGWKGDLSFWSVKNDVIFGQTTKENPSGGNFLVWDGEVSDFEITLKSTRERQ